MSQRNRWCDNPAPPSAMAATLPYRRPCRTGPDRSPSAAGARGEARWTCGPDQGGARLGAVAGDLRLLRRRAGVTLAVYRPLTVAVLVEGAVYAFFFVLGFATVGLVVALRRPANLIGWLYGAAGLAWAYTFPWSPGSTSRHPRASAPAARRPGRRGVRDLGWAPAIALGVTLPALLLPNGHLRSRRWRLVVASSVTGVVLVIVAGSSRAGGGARDRQPAGAGRHGGRRRRAHRRRRGAALVEPAAGGGLRGAAVPLLPWDRAPADALGAAARGGAGSSPAGSGSRPTGSRTSSSRPCCRPVVSGWRWCCATGCGPGPPRQPHRHLRPVTALLVVPYLAGRARGRPPGRRLGQPGRGRRHPGRGRPVPAAPPGPGPGRPALQPPPLRRRPHPGRVRGLGCATRSTWTPCTASCWVVDQTMQPTRASLWLRHAP